MVLRANFDSLNHKVLLQETAKELGVTVLKSGVLKHKGKIAYYVVGTTNDKERKRGIGSVLCESRCTKNHHDYRIL
jgi:hypothetical protein